MSLWRGAVLGALLVLTAAAQLAFPVGPAARWAAPDLVPALVFCAAATAGPRLGALTGFAAGVILDVAPPAGHPLGQWAFVLAACGACAGVVLRVVHHPIWNLAGAAVVAVATQALFVGLGLALGDVHARTDDTLRTVLPAIAWTVACVAVLLPAVRRLIRLEASLN
jgi:rod shape-determining protein MreD